MSLKTHVITSLVSLAVGAGGAWYLAPRPVRVEFRDRTRTVTIRETVRTRTTTRPDGTRIVERTESDTSRKTAADVSSISQPHPRWAVSLLGGADLKLQPVLGAHATYRVVGPFTAGVFALGGPGTAAGGVSLGVTF